MTVVGFVGLGNMGSVLAANLVASGHEVVTHDIAGPEHSPDGATFVSSLDDVALRAEAVVLSVPDGAVSERVARVLVAATDRRTTFVVDTSTIGVVAARAIDGLLAAESIGYVDAPVSGGVAGARARTLSVMYAGADSACTAAEPVLAGLGDRRRRVGDRPGMAQALKLANNFLSATTLAATSEAVAFGLSVGLDLATMIEVLDASSGQSAATQRQVPHPGADGALRRRVRQFTDEQGPPPLPGRGRGTGGSVGPGPDHGLGVGALRRGGARRGLHAHLSLCRRARLTSVVGRTRS